MTPVLRIDHATLAYGQRTLWSGLDLDVAPGEFITVLGSNGTGKSSLLKAILGLVPLSAGSVMVDGEPARRGSRRIGYIPQQRGYAVDVPLRGKDLVRLGIDGNRWGLPLPWRSAARNRVAELVERVGATSYAHRPLGQLSGGEQQRLRIAQALATDPAVLLCDEPLLSLDLRHQRQVVALIDQQRREHGTSVVFVTHEINPVLPVTDRVLYLHDGRFRIGSPQDVMTSEVLSELYQSPIEVIRRGDQLIVLGADDAGHTHPHDEEEPA
ncbi:ABC transporter ATP-binding protein [Nocardioides sp.]|uniref:metal ABC transporter ATP-binding protein n=1 Tax=Nocardioides sp. TaxID=35761 RepID=UPI0026093FE8|nr:ABC transporter ATP-binding protein [Nocardioides sp.]